MKAIQIYDYNKYSDESHSKMARDTLIEINSILYNWLSTPFSTYFESVYIIFEVIPGSIFRMSSGVQRVKFSFMKLAIPKIDKPKVWNSFKEIE